MPGAVDGLDGRGGLRVCPDGLVGRVAKWGHWGSGRGKLKTGRSELDFGVGSVQNSGSHWPQG